MTRRTALRRTLSTTIVLGLVFAPIPPGARAQADEMAVIYRIMSGYSVVSNITYRTVNGWDGKLDVYVPRGSKTPSPTLVYYHGGGWRVGTKEERALLLMPYLLMGWSVVNVEYRLSDVAKAPAAVEDARCALRWVYKNARTTLKTSGGPAQLNFDLTKVVTSGTSAGGHLALIVGMAPASAGLDTTCAGDRSGGTHASGPNNTDQLKVAAIVDWFGISDVHDVLGSDATSLGGSFVGDGSNRTQIARQVSPITYVRPGLPPVISIHGDKDPVVPYPQKRRLHEALEKAGVAHQLITIQDGEHGTFSAQDQLNAYASIRAFLTRHDIIRSLQ